MNKTEKLLPCPFCGQQPTEYAIEPHTHALQFSGGKMPDHQGSHVIECACGCGIIDTTREEVFSVWNRRPTPCLHQIQELAPVQAAQPSDKDLLDVLGGELDSSNATFIKFARAVLAKFTHLPQVAPAAVAVPDAVISGALFDFCGYLTTLPKESAITASGSHDASPMVEALKAWGEKRNLKLDDADVQGWSAALAATPAADAPLYAEMLAALQSVGMDAVGVGGGENTISDSARAKVEAVLEKIGAPWPSSDTAAAAPVVLPEPACFVEVSRQGSYLAFLTKEDVKEQIDNLRVMGRTIHLLYTEQQVRALLAGLSAPAAQAAPAAQSVANADGRFTKNPVTIDAIKWTGSNLREVIAFTDGPPDTRSIHAGMAWEAYVDLVARDGLKIYTLEGKMLANIGDWIIRGIKGEYYPCKPDIFEATYTSAPQAQAVERDALTPAARPGAERPRMTAQTYEAWRISYQSSEQAVRAAFARVVELEAELVKEASRTVNQKTRADQMSLQHDHQAALNRDARNQLTQLTTQLEAIGAGGVESLRKK